LVSMDLCSNSCTAFVYIFLSVVVYAKHIVDSL
jgi:hypothetical protein